MEPAERIASFYAALGRRDWATMQACYHPEASFGDPAFQMLNAAQVQAMWRMLCERGTDLRVEVSPAIPQADGSWIAQWQAWYTFSQTGRKVHNIIDTQIRFRDGLFLTHRDHFDLWRWSRQAIGPLGVLLGWSPLLQNKIRGQAMHSLAKYMAKQAAA